MATFSFKLSTDSERKVEELMACGGYTFKCDVFLEALNLLYNHAFQNEDEANVIRLNGPSAISTETLSAREFRARIVETTDEFAEESSTPSAYERLVRVFGVYNGG